MPDAKMRACLHGMAWQHMAVKDRTGKGREGKATAWHGMGKYGTLLLLSRWNHERRSSTHLSLSSK